MPHTWALWNRWWFFVLITTIAVITVLNLFSVVTPKLSPSTQTSIIQCCLYGSSSLSSILFKVNWVGQSSFMAESGRSQTCGYTVLFVFWFGERVSLCSSDWLMTYSVLKVIYPSSCWCLQNSGVRDGRNHSCVYLGSEGCFQPEQSIFCLVFRCYRWTLESEVHTAL